MSTGVICNPRQEHLRGGKAHVAVMKPFKPATLAYLVTRWKQQDFYTASITAADPSGMRRGGGGGLAAADHLEPEHMGMSTEGLIAKMRAALADGRKGTFLPDGHKFGLALSASEATVRGTLLKRD